ncbi:type IV secretion system protein [Sporolituus thermophilus]|uniref:Type IV secretory pathway, TrbF components n=1 Tax=Sporolituus thermophilus DSM 23256 TaxID=1123285 RepID=A0A1G7MI17_9FIRM|nr:type IV secretion system protein [Sporolituus thermophilus]SDF61351.1 Type IV secretory pathway, TrbF components [Sporolituus thermophilus DSM 23256]
MDRYKAAQNEWDRRVGQVVVVATAWRNAALIFAAVAAILGGALVYYVSSVNSYVYVAEVADGQVTKVVDISRNSYSPSTQVISYFLSDFVRKIYTISADAELNRANITDVRAFLSDAVAKKIQNVIDGRAQLSRDYVAYVEILSISQLSKDSYQVRFVDRLASRTGGLAQQQKYVAIITLKRMDITKWPQAQIMRNPLGLVVTDFSVTAEVN